MGRKQTWSWEPADGWSEESSKTVLPTKRVPGSSPEALRFAATSRRALCKPQASRLTGRRGSRWQLPWPWPELGHGSVRLQLLLRMSLLLGMHGLASFFPDGTRHWIGFRKGFIAARCIYSVANTFRRWQMLCSVPESEIEQRLVDTSGSVEPRPRGLHPSSASFRLRHFGEILNPRVPHFSPLWNGGNNWTCLGGHLGGRLYKNLRHRVNLKYLLHSWLLLTFNLPLVSRKNSGVVDSVREALLGQKVVILPWALFCRRPHRWPAEPSSSKRKGKSC